MDQVILVDLDTLLDTRIATLSKINPEAAIKAIRTESYYNRSINDFKTICGITKSVFDEAYAKRDVLTLKISLPTSAIIALRTMMADLTGQKETTPFAEDVKLVINTYPYDLNQEEANAIAGVMSGYSGLKPEKVSTVKIAWEDLTPRAIRGTYTGLMIYNFREWMEQQQDQFLKVKMPEVVVLAPALYLDHIPTEEEYKMEGSDGLSPFDITEGMLAGCFDLTFLDVSYFSIIPPQALRPPATKP